MAGKKKYMQHLTMKPMLFSCLTQKGEAQRLEEIRCIAGKSMVSVLMFLVNLWK